jgi:phosphatidyl-myo-inositol dimannoside synthase
MRLLVSLDHLYTQTPDGAVWTTAMHDHAYWQRYLDVFTEVLVVARVRPVAQGAGLRADGPGVTFLPVPMYEGPWQFLRQRRNITRLIDAALVPAHTAPGLAICVRVPSQLGYLVAARSQRAGLPFAAEVVADPWTFFTAGVTRHPLRPLMRRLSAAKLRNVCRNAAQVCYVTTEALQRAYPADPRALTESVLDIDLDDAWFSPVSRTPPAGDPILVLVGNFPALYKGQDLLIRALPELLLAGFRCQLHLVGEGRQEAVLRHLAEVSGVAGQVHFLGSAAGAEAVRARLDAATIFVLPSRSEGLPRSLVEAMARGLPCLATAVGGIPELLDAEDLLPVDDLPALVRSLLAVLTDAPRQTRMGERNRAVAQGYHRQRIADRRLRFLHGVRTGAQP